MDIRNEPSDGQGMEAFVQKYIIHVQKIVVDCEEQLLGLSLVIESYLFVFYLILFMGKMIPNPIAKRICFNIVQKCVGIKFFVFQLVCAICYLGLLKTIQKAPKDTAMKGTSLALSLSALQAFPLLLIIRNRENLNGIFGIVKTKSQPQPVYTTKNMLYVSIGCMAHFILLFILMSCLRFSPQSMVYASAGAFAPYFYLKSVGVFDSI